MLGTTCAHQGSGRLGVVRRFSGKPLQAWFARADAFVLSSRYQGFPTVVPESLACGTPVIATPSTGGTREIPDGIPPCLAMSNSSIHYEPI